jgi:steroid delta-isomerase-like uncharacterized protein
MATITSQDNGTLAREVYAAFSGGDYGKVLSLVTDDIEAVFEPTGQVFRGKAAFEQFFMVFKTAMPDVELIVTNQVVTADAVVSEFIARGTHTGPLLGPDGAIPATGKVAEWPVVEVCTVRDGKLATLHNYQDTASMLRQLGLIK